MKRRITFLTVLLLVTVALVIVGARAFGQQRPPVRATATAHSVVLTWAASSDGAANPTLAYNIYRAPRLAAKVQRHSMVSRSRRAAPQRAPARTRTLASRSGALTFTRSKRP
jgi:hypothetical protein